jgi:hypothetical protein
MSCSPRWVDAGLGVARDVEVIRGRPLDAGGAKRTDQAIRKFDARDRAAHQSAAPMRRSPACLILREFAAGPPG